MKKRFNKLNKSIVSVLHLNQTSIILTICVTNMAWLKSMRLICPCQVSIYWQRSKHRWLDIYNKIHSSCMPTFFGPKRFRNTFRTLNYLNFNTLLKFYVQKCILVRELRMNQTALIIYTL